MQRITDKVYSVQGLWAGRVYLIEGLDGLTLIDASLPGSEKRIGKEMASLGHSWADVKHILITHAHPDHVGGLPAIQQLTDAPTSIHSKDVAVARGEAAIPRPPKETLSGLMRLMPGRETRLAASRIDRELQEGETLDEILPGLTVIAEPGHSPGQVGFWWAEKHLLIGGDVAANMPMRGLTRPFAGFTPDMAEAERSIRKVAAMGVDILCVGHGVPITRNASALIDKLVQKFKA